MSVKHLVEGEACPPLKPGLIRIYSMKYCPFAALTRLVLAHKDIPHEIVNIHLKKKPQWYFDKNPLGAVPCLETEDGKLIYDSAICNEYLDRVYPQNKLIPDDPYERAQVYMLMERYVSTVAGHLASPLWSGPDPERIAKGQKGLEYFEKLLEDGREFFGGAQLNLLDIRFWPNFEKLELIKEKAEVDPVPADRFPRLTAWRARMQKTRAGINAATDLVNMRKMDPKNPDYDVGVEF